MGENAMSERWTFPWEREAQNGEDMPDGLFLVDMMAYTTLRNIYGAYHDKRLARDQAAHEKRLLRRKWEQAKQADAFDRKLTAYHVQLIRAVEQAICNCRKNPSPENALRLCDVIDGLERPEAEE